MKVLGVKTAGTVSHYFSKDNEGLERRKLKPEQMEALAEMLQKINSGAIDAQTDDEKAYYLIEDSDKFRPRIKAGEFILIEPSKDISPLKDVLVCLSSGELMLKEYISEDGEYYYLGDINEAGHRIRLNKSEVNFIHRKTGTRES